MTYQLILDFLLLHNALIGSSSPKPLIDYIQMLYSILIAILPVLVLSSCSSSCATCTNPNALPGSNRCTSCYSNYILDDYHCYSCGSCDYYDICDQCGQSSTTSSNTQIYAIIFGLLAGLTFIFIVIACIYRRCKARSLPEGIPRINNISSQELILPPPINWVKSDRMINVNQNCAICLQNNVSVQIKCLHLYHPNCIWEWCSKREHTCPLCKNADIQPVHIYCQRCLIAYIEININFIPTIRGDERWRYCNSCKDGQ